MLQTPVVPARSAYGKGRQLRSNTIGRFLAREKRLRLVVKELTHRTKNLLTVVQAIGKQTAQHSDDLDTYQRAFPQRIDALSRSLDLLINDGESGVSVRELVQRQLEPFAKVDEARIVVAGPSALLNQDATQNLGLALHELATNATKYGALSVPDGGISVHWDLAPGCSGSERFRLIWLERNGPQVATPEHHGFGSMVLQRIGAAMSGHVQHDFDAVGVSFTLEAPAAAILMATSSE